MKLFTKDNFGYLFQISAIILLFSYSPVESGNNPGDDANQNILAVKKSGDDLKVSPASKKELIAPAVSNYIFKTKLSVDKSVKMEAENSTNLITSQNFAEAFSISLRQIGLKKITNSKRNY